jgi:hypothetical protein
MEDGMNANIVTRWEDLRDIVDGPKRHQRAVAEWLEQRAAVLYWGDSWFSTPLYPNLARQSAERIDGLRVIIGKPGATAAQLISPKQVDAMIGRINGNPIDLLALSVGGNDALSERLAKVFAPWMKAARAPIAPADAFQRLLDSGMFERLREQYDHLLDALRRKVQKKRPNFRVVGHGYAPLRRIGDAGDLTISNIGLIAILKDDVGPWLYGPMKRVLASPAEGKVFADLLLVDGFRDRVLVPMQHAYPGLFSCADFSTVAGLADPAVWYDEIHPTEHGFAFCRALLNDAIRAALPAAKRASVG